MFEDIMFGYVMPLMTIIGSVVTLVLIMGLIGSLMDGSFTTVTTIRPSGATYVKTDVDELPFPNAERYKHFPIGHIHWHNGSRYIKSFRGWVLTNGAR